jgi:hypothetical protein
MNKLSIYEKKFKGGKDGKGFKKTFARTEAGSVLECQMSETAKAELVLAKLEWPVIALVDEGDYFIKDKAYTAKDGSSKTKEILVIKAWNSLSQGEFRNKTLSDIDAERAD